MVDSTRAEHLCVGPWSCPVPSDGQDEGLGLFRMMALLKFLSGEDSMGHR